MSGHRTAAGRFLAVMGVVTLIAACDDGSTQEAGRGDLAGQDAGAGGAGGGSSAAGGSSRNPGSADIDGGAAHASRDASASPDASPSDQWGGAGGAGGAAGGSAEGGSGWEAPDAGLASPDASALGDAAPAPGTNIALGGAQDFGYFRRLLNEGTVPTSDSFDAAGFFAEHHTSLPPPACGRRICLQTMLGVMANVMDGEPMTMLQLGLNSPIVAADLERPPLTLAVVIDVSGSMRSDGKIGFVRTGLRQMINELYDDDQVALIAYESDVRVLAPMQTLADNRNALQNIVNDLAADGGTNLYAGLERGYQEVFAHYDSGRQNRVILLSDGEPTAGITDADSILELSRRYNSDGVGLTTVGLGSAFNYQLMRGLAEQGDGNFYFVEDAGAVEEVFTEELSYFTFPIAFDLHLQLQAGQDFTFGRAYGSSFWTDTPTGGELDVPSVFLAHRESHDDVHENPDGGDGRRGGGSALLVQLIPREDDGSDPESAQVATVDVSFREPGSDEIVEDSVRVNYPEAPWLMRPQGFFENTTVEKSFVMLNIFQALARACDLVHQDHAPDRAVGLLTRVIAAVADYELTANNGEGDVDMQFDIELMVQLRDVILGQGGQEPDNLDVPEDPWPAN